MAKGFLKKVWENARESDIETGHTKPKNASEEALTRSSEENKEVFKSYENLQNQIKEQIRNSDFRDINSKTLAELVEKLKKYEERAEGIINAGQKRALDLNDLINRDRLSKEEVSGKVERGRKDSMYFEQASALDKNPLLSEAQIKAEKSKKSAEEARLVAEKDAQNLEAIRRRIQEISPEKEAAA